jgi:hypothetical protein
LWVLPFRTLRHLLSKITPTPSVSVKEGTTSIDKIVWTIEVASRYVPRTTCLVQALAAQVLLAQQGYPANLRIGVAQSETGGLEAHAWVESQEKVVIGDLVDLSGYKSLPPLDGENQ